jgi:predicted nuclease of predicted toxin-antitoxin system
MLKLLLDEHIAPAVAVGLKKHVRSIEVHALRDWQEGAFLGERDETILAEAAALGLTLVTYDLHTIPKILSDWIQSGRSHGGVVFISPRTIRPREVGRLVAALTKLAKETGSWDWTNRVVFLRR